LKQIQDRGLEEDARCAELATPAGFLRALRELLAVELTAEPCLRSYMRKEVYQ
jgi:hypothetical protein